MHARSRESPLLVAALVLALGLGSGPPAIASEVTASATGGGKFLFAGTIPMKFAFGAVAKADGSASGSFHHTYEADGFSYAFWGRVTCLSVDDVNNRAWIGGVLTKIETDDPEVTLEVGDDAWFRVLDTGNSSVTPDRSTAMGFIPIFPSSAEYCAQRPWPADNARTHPVTSGNITVH